MIAHVSVPSKDPKVTALFFAALIDGEAFPFPVVEGAWIAVASDGSGTAIEVYPEHMAHHAGQGGADANAKPQGPKTLPWEDQIYPDGSQLRPSAFHFAMSSHLSESAVMDRAQAAGFRTVRCDRAGVFALVEIWIDNMFLVEVLCGHEVERYAGFMNPVAVGRMFGAGIRPS